MSSSLQPHSDKWCIFVLSYLSCHVALSTPHISTPSLIHLLTSYPTVTTSTADTDRNSINNHHKASTNPLPDANPSNQPTVRPLSTFFSYTCHPIFSCPQPKFRSPTLHTDHIPPQVSSGAVLYPPAYQHPPQCQYLQTFLCAFPVHPSHCQ